ncbi:peptidase C39 bacteriocin processing [Waterburya agarophytonicola K14]|uniref:Peptidase C39 bacteriocin processing n=1 Tax=Waterburya agarophytonicola KI4 TaxID=2874699 RepID=A0A964BQ11_9CYAN|nr:peptidase C39 bacteriocin processing [Waterburya agarophytonicola]MCC0176752.1 peptidase C39 bacteriocin processing [Waterburya agarophytonicola KI4]
MTITVLVCALAFACGAMLGKNLAAIGITSDNALKNHQRSLVWLLIALMPVLGILVILDKFHLASVLPKIFPPMLLIYLAGYFNEIILGMGCFFLGLLLVMELSEKRSRQKVVQLLVALGAIAFALSILLFFLQPVQAMVAKPKLVNGVIIQTTPYTCAPSSIATLSRVTKKHPIITEREVVALTRTNRFGTTTLSEIRAMEKLELNPEYRHNLTVEDLISLNKPALLHVKEKPKSGKGVRFSHAVALLSINPQKRLILIANPLYGMQIKTFEEFAQYWFGEAILVDLEQARIS